MYITGKTEWQEYINADQMQLTAELHLPIKEGRRSRRRPRYKVSAMK